MKKIISIFVLFLLTTSVPVVSRAQIVNCGNTPDTMCTIDNLLDLVPNIMNVIFRDIITPLSVILLIIGGALYIVSAGDPEKAKLGKKIVVTTIIGMALAFGAWVIVQFVLQLIGVAAPYQLQ